MAYTNEQIEKVKTMQRLHASFQEYKKENNYAFADYVRTKWNALFAELKESIGMNGIFEIEDILKGT